MLLDCVWDFAYAIPAKHSCSLARICSEFAFTIRTATESIHTESDLQCPHVVLVKQSHFGLDLWE